MKRIWLVLILVLLVTGTAAAEEPQFELTATDTKINEGETTYLQLVLTNARGAERVEIKGIDNFKSASRGSSTQIKIVNGERSFIKKYNYALTPTDIGEFTLQGVVKYQGQLHKTNQLTITVTEGKSANNQPDKLFIETNLSENEIYLGQKAVLEYTLFSRYQVQNFGFQEQIEVDNFMVNNLGKTEGEIVRIEGKKYLKQKVAQVVLTPMETGTFKIPSYKFQVNLSSGDGFFSTTTARQLITEPEEIKVLPLPQKDQPDDFSGIVGKLDVEEDYSKTKVKYGNSVTLSATLQGNCNLDNLNNIVKQDLPQVEVYETEKSSEEQIKGGNYYAEKEYEIIFIPWTGGEVKIPDFKLSYFNPQTKEYERAVIKGKTLKVTGQPQKVEDGVSGERVTISQITVPEGEEENYYILRIKKDYLHWLGIGLLILILISGLGFAGYNYRRNSGNELAKIYRKLRRETKEERIYQLFNELIKAEFGVSIKASSYRKIKKEIDDRQLTVDIQKVVNYFETDKKDIDLKAKISSIYQRIKKES